MATTSLLDQVTLNSVSPPPGSPLRLGHPVRFQVAVEYSIGSREAAALALYIEMFPKKAGGCTGESHRTNGGAYLAVERGTAAWTITVAWPGNSPKQIGAPGYLTFGASLWTPDRKQLVKAFGILDPAQYCYSFS